MDYKELLKKYWFVGIIGIALIVFVGVYALDAYNNRELTVSSKQVDGKYAVYSVDGEYVFADDFYNSLFTQNGLNCEFIAFQREIFNKSYETTDEMNTIAGNYAAYMYQTYGDAYVDDQLKQMGYIGGVGDLNNYYIDSQKRDLLITDYIKAHSSEILDPFMENYTPRVIYHILVKVADISSETDDDGNTTYTANPTQEETDKLNAILEALESRPFQEVATEYSDDGSAQYGGYIGCISKVNSANYYPIFSETSLALADNEVSDVITSQAGYHIIWNAGSSIDTLSGDSEFLSEIENQNPTLSIKAIMNKADELGYKIVDEQLQTYIDTQIQTIEQQMAEAEAQMNAAQESEDAE